MAGRHTATITYETDYDALDAAHAREVAIDVARAVRDAIDEVIQKAGDSFGVVVEMPAHDVAVTEEDLQPEPAAAAATLPRSAQDPEMLSRAESAAQTLRRQTNVPADTAAKTAARPAAKKPAMEKTAPSPARRRTTKKAAAAPGAADA